MSCWECDGLLFGHGTNPMTLIWPLGGCAPTYRGIEARSSLSIFQKEEGA